MEFPELGEHCNEPACKKLDFLPVKCDACGKTFCSEHMNYEKHNCPNAYQKDVQVPICPLCGSPVPTPRNQKPDIAVSEHIDKECRFDRSKKKISSNKCSVQGCKIREMIPVICSQCKKNFCLQHRFPDVHHCEKKRSGPLEAALYRCQENESSALRAIQGNMSEDEALARALSESMRGADKIVSRSQESTIQASKLNEKSLKRDKEPNNPDVDECVLRAN